MKKLYFKGQIVERDGDDAQTILDIGGIEVEPGEEKEFEQMAKDYKINSILKPVMEKLVFAHDNDFTLPNIKKAVKDAISSGLEDAEEVYQAAFKALSE